jgi:TRAP-type mannitol/chloroaromatic compound transport system permease small subunit
MLNGFHSAPESDTFPQSNDVAILIGNLVLASVCLISINSYTLLGPSFFYNDAHLGIIFANNRRITLAKAAIFQMVLGVFFFILLVILGVFGAAPGTPISYYFDQASNAGGIIGFTFYIIVMIGGMRNRKTKKVVVKKLKN